MSLLQIAIAFDQLGNTVLGGWADETLSARAFRCQHRSWCWRVARRAIDTLFFWQYNHCENAYRSERERLQAPPEER